MPAVTSIHQSFEYVPFQSIAAETVTKFISMYFPPVIASAINLTDRSTARALTSR